MKRVLQLSTLCFCSIVAVFIWLDLYRVIDLPKVYSDKLQTPLFSGFLTLGSFLLSLKAFILLRLKQDVYDRPTYEAQVRERRGWAPETPYYQGLQELSVLLVSAVLFSLSTSALQLTLGFWHSVYAAAICVASAATTLGVVLFCWWHIKENLKVWFENSEKEKMNVRPDVNDPEQR